MPDAKAVNFAFIIGTGRCGTTMLGQMLGSHPELCVPPELQVIFDAECVEDRLVEAFAGKDPDVDFTAEELIALIEKSCPYKLDFFFDYNSYCHNIKLENLTAGGFVAGFYAAIAKAHQKSWLIEQTPWYGQRIGLLLRLLPGVKFIHIVRDGRDVALSFSRTPWWYQSVHLNLARWAKEIRKIVIDASVYLDESSYLEVRYEDIVAKPQYELERICGFLGVDFDPVMCDASQYIRYEHHARFNFEKGSSRNYKHWKSNSSTPVFTANIEAWRREKELFACKFTDEINTMLKKFGYPAADAEAGYHPKYYFSLDSLINALKEDMVKLEETVKSRDEKIASLHALLKEMHESTSWRITQPWRSFFNIFK